MSQWTIRKRLAAGLSVILFLSVSLAGYCALVMRPAASAMAELARDHLPEIALSTAFEREILNARIHFIYHVTIQKPGALDAGWRRFQNARELMAKLSAQVAASEALGSLRRPTADLRDDLDRYEIVLRRILDVVEKRRDSGPAFTQLIAEWADSGGRVVNAAGELNRRCTAFADASARNHSSTLHRAATWSWLACGLGLFSSLAVGWLLNRGIDRVLRRIVADLNAAVQQICGASRQVATSSRLLAEGASRQASSLEETSASTGEISSVAENNSVQAGAAAELVSNSLQRFNEADAVLEKMVAAITEIRRQSESVSNIIKAIDGIAFQTNILALNAAVEAARAGEAGMGFAVVADEVRNLAQRSARSAGDTASLIERSLATAVAGNRRVDEVVQAIRTITAEASHVKTLVDGVNQHSREQTRGIRQIARALDAVGQVTQANAAGAQQIAAASAEFDAQADAVRGIVAQLNRLL